MLNTLEKLIEKFRSGKRLTKNEFELLHNYINNSNEESEISLLLKENWQKCQPETVDLPFEKLRHKIRLTSGKNNSHRLFIFLSRAAAILFVPLFLVTMYLYLNPFHNTGKLMLSTQKGERTSVVLPDGSKVWLNADSRLFYPSDYGEKSRNIEIEGEAYFEVAKNKELPFRVTSGDIVTEALGTKFIVSAYPDRLEIKSSLVEGSVRISSGNVQKVLTAGQQLVYHKKQSQLRLRAFDVNSELAWKNNQLTFRLMPFCDVISVLEKWYDVEIEFDPDHFKSETLTVRFKEYETLETILQVLAKTNSFSYYLDDDVIRIKELKN